ncbi:hypothetical protein KIW84_040265 [Lathyrus oleraceus]|uniref:B-like cyclin n=1 Tax=Pisum sativum TaxID=3888 RepID=A0A9D5AJV6_PEA|nr:hypothetical protein KIW84_040265 [Pisum sativum]
MARLITGVENFYALNFILGILIENGQLYLLLQKYFAAADTNTGTNEAVRGFRMAVLTSLKHFNPNDLDAIALVIVLEFCWRCWEDSPSQEYTLQWIRKVLIYAVLVRLGIFDWTCSAFHGFLCSLTLVLFDGWLEALASGSVSLDESMSTSNSLMTPEFKYTGNGDVASIKSIENRTSNILNISDSSKMADVDTILKSRANKIVDLDCNFKDPRFCASIANEIYENLRVSEKIKRPSIDFMEKIQTDINAGMRAMFIDWLVKVAEEYRLLPDTLFLAVNYLDRYLSGKAMNRQWLQLLGVSCMMIAAT